MNPAPPVTTTRIVMFADAQRTREGPTRRNCSGHMQPLGRSVSGLRDRRAAVVVSLQPVELRARVAHRVVQGREALP
jgi:hypothetical protein